jgi:prolyl oligopeptidase
VTSERSAAHPPPTRVEPVEEILHGEVIVDPYRWLEDSDAPETRSWVAAQNAYTRETLDSLPRRAAIRARLDRMLHVGFAGAPQVRGARCFYLRRAGRQDQPVLVLREGDGAGRILVDPNVLSASGVVALDWWQPSPDGRLLAYGLSEGGDEWSTLHVLDVDSGAALPGEQIPRTRWCSLAWLPDASSFYYTRYPEPGSVPTGEEGYHRRVYLHRLGADWRADPEVFGAGRAKEDLPSVYLDRRDGRWLLVSVYQGAARTEVYVLDRDRPDAAFVPIIAGVEARSEPIVQGGRVYLRTNLDAPDYRLVAVDPERPDRERWQEVLPERSDRVLATVRPVAGLLAAEELQDASSHLRLYQPDGALRREVALPSLGTLVGIGGEWNGDAVYFGFTSFAQPLTAYRVDPATGAAHVFAAPELPPDVDPAQYAVRQVWYPSHDGTRVSMFLVHRPGLALDDDNPTVLTGYGGFNVSRTPAFMAAVPLWLDAGGVYALPNLRGGGEYGEAWHQAGMLERKQNVFDDFIAAAEWLIANGYTQPRRLAIGGGSNGGLLVGAALTQRPELFQAVVCAVPLLDMLRYHHFLIAKYWVPEYGSADDPAHFCWLRAYSPYHSVREGERYPAVFLLTAEGDGRVDPMHARKMAARLQVSSGSDAPVLLRVETAAGHGIGKPRNKILDEQTDVWSFLGWQLGVDVTP